MPVCDYLIDASEAVTTSGGGANQGTAFEVLALKSAIWNVTGSLARFADVGHPFTLSGDGTIYHPFDTVTETVNEVQNGGVVSIVAGDYLAILGNTFTAGADGRAMTLEAPVGTVVIGK